MTVGSFSFFLDLHVRNLTEMRQLSLELFCSVVGRISHTPEHKSLRLYDDFLEMFLCKFQDFYASKIHVFLQYHLHNFRVARMTEHSDFDRFLYTSLFYSPRLGPFFSRSSKKPSSKLVDTSLVNCNKN